MGIYLHITYISAYVNYPMYISYATERWVKDKRVNYIDRFVAAMAWRLRAYFAFGFMLKMRSGCSLLLDCQGLCVALSALWQQRLPAEQYITSLSKLNHLIYYAMQISRNLP
jgi:hypothetical protein